MPEELFSHAWTWNPSKVNKELKSKQKTAPSSSLLSKPRETIKNTNPLHKAKEAKAVKSVKAKSQVTGPSAKPKGLVPMTPVIKSKHSDRDLAAFDFNTVVPTLACTPVQKLKAPPSVQKAPQTASKLHFHVYEELSPAQDKVQPVPAAPRRTKKSRFKVGI